MVKKYGLYSAVALAAFMAACADSSPRNPLSPSEANLPSADAPAIADAKLKAPAPELEGPADGELLNTLRPTLAARTTAAPHARGISLQYQFQVLTGSSVVADSGPIDASGDQVIWTVPAGALRATTNYTWQARAVYGEAGSRWASKRFETPTPSLGAQCASDNPHAIIACASGRWPERLQSRDNDDLGRRHDMEFLRDRIIEAGVCGGLKFGWNTKANGELSIDFLVWRDREGSNPHNGPGVEDWGIDLAFDYDNNANPLYLGWRPHGPGANYTEYVPTPVCIF